MSDVAGRHGVSRSLVYTVLGRTWSALAGPLSLVFVGRFLTKEEQGFYYTFWSLLGFWLFFDLGLSLLIVQFASHERASLHLVDGQLHGDARAHQRLASLYRLTSGWYRRAAVLMVVIILPAGFLFFSRYETPQVAVNWVGPWILVVLSTAANLTLAPVTSILEGSGLLQDVSLMRLLQSIAGSGMLWISLAAGASLYSAVILNATMGLFALSWIGLRHRRFFRGLWSVSVTGDRIKWRSEIWPLQWRIAVSWTAAYFTFQGLNPIAFALLGPIVAGQVGMSLMVCTAVYVFAQAWMTTRAVDFGAFVAARDFEALDRSFRQVVVQSSMAAVVLSVLVVMAAAILRRAGHPLAERLVGPLPLDILIVATLLNHIVSAEATYLRAFKQEPFVRIFLPICVLTMIGGLAVANRFGPTGMFAVLAVALGFVGLGGGTALFVGRRRQWRKSPPAMFDRGEPQATYARF